MVETGWLRRKNVLLAIQRRIAEKPAAGLLRLLSALAPRTASVLPPFCIRQRGWARTGSSTALVHCSACRCILLVQIMADVDLVEIESEMEKGVAGRLDQVRRAFEKNVR